MEKVELGNTNLYVSKVGMGALIIGPSQANLTIKEGANVISYAVRNGMNLIDTAEAYNTYPYIKEALIDLEKESLTKDLIISSKSLSEDYDGMRNAVLSGLKEINREYFDIFFMHEVRSKESIKRTGAWKALIDLKKEGKVKYIGVSTHHTDVVKEFSNNPDCDVIFAIINFKGMGIRTGLSDNEIEQLDSLEINSRINRHRCLDKEGTIDEMLDAINLAKDNHKGFIAMKAFGGGNLVSSYQEALDFLFAKPNIDCIMVGFKTEKEVDDILSYLDNSIDKKYIPNTKEKKVRINKGDCEGCGLCIKTCPQNAISYDKDGLSIIDNTKCITCGYCAQVCPNRAIIMY